MQCNVEHTPIPNSLTMVKKLINKYSKQILLTDSDLYLKYPIHETVVFDDLICYLFMKSKPMIKHFLNCSLLILS